MKKKVILAAVCKKYKELLSRRCYYRAKRVKLIGLHLLRQSRLHGRRLRRFWVRNIFKEAAREKYGASNTIIREIRGDPEMFFNYFRMLPQQFDELLNALEPYITKTKMSFRTPISAQTRLEITLRYLADGGSMTSLQYAYRVAKQTISNIILECCIAIWECLSERVFPDFSEGTWCEIANAFKIRWNFDHCIGAIDGKHINIQAPANSGSTYFNYKGNHSIVLLAVATADYKFSMVDIGFPGRQSDSTIFQNSPIGIGFRNSEFNVPAPRKPCDEYPTPLPYVLVGDEAFGLSTFLMRPYPRSTQLTIEKKVFNYRLSRARRVVESAFGILASRWRIFRRNIIASEKTVIASVQAAVCLHNFLMDKEKRLSVNKQQYSSNKDLEPCTLNSLTKVGSNMYSRKAAEIRENYTHYFNGVGNVEFQMSKVLNNDY